MLLSLFLVCFVALSLTTVLLLVAGHRLRVASRLIGSFCAIVLAVGSGEIAASIWRLQTSYVWAGEAFLLFLTLLVVMLRRRWNPLGQVFYGSFLASALAYLAFALVDPTDYQEFGRTLSGLLEDGDGAARMGREAHRRILDEFLDPRHLVQFGQVLQGVLDAPGHGPRARPPET